MGFVNFIKKYWYPICAGLIILISIIVLIIGGYIKFSVKEIPPAFTNCRSPPQGKIPIAEISIGSNKEKSDTNSYCPITSGSPWYSIPISGNNQYMNQYNGGTPYSQVCIKPANKICDQTNVVTDINIVNMGNHPDNDKYTSVPYRCCYGPDDTSCTSYAPMQIAEPVPSTEDSGILPNSVSGCSKMGICVQKQTIKQLQDTGGKYLPLNNIKFAVSDSGKTGNQVCQEEYGEDFVSDGTNLYEGCVGNKYLYLCKKYVSL